MYFACIFYSVSFNELPGFWWHLKAPAAYGRNVFKHSSETAYFSAMNSANFQAF